MRHFVSVLRPSWHEGDGPATRTHSNIDPAPPNRFVPMIRGMGTPLRLYSGLAPTGFCEPMNAGGARARTADASSRERRRRASAVEQKVNFLLIELCDGPYRGAPRLTWEISGTHKH